MIEAAIIILLLVLFFALTFLGFAVQMDATEKQLREQLKSTELANEQMRKEISALNAEVKRLSEIAKAVEALDVERPDSDEIALAAKLKGDTNG
jgi:cell division protein FtsB